MFAYISVTLGDTPHLSTFYISSKVWLCFVEVNHVDATELLDINFKSYEMILELLALWLFDTAHYLIFCYSGFAWSFWGYACYAFCPWISWIFQCYWSKIYINHYGSNSFPGFGCKSLSFLVIVGFPCPHRLKVCFA